MIYKLFAVSLTITEIIVTIIKKNVSRELSTSSLSNKRCFTYCILLSTVPAKLTLKQFQLYILNKNK